MMAEQLTDPALGHLRSSAGATTYVGPPARTAAAPVASDDATAGDFPTRPDGTPDFARMSPEQRLAYHRRRLDQMFQ